MADVDPASPSRTRLAYDELLASQLALALLRERDRKRTGRIHSGDGHLRNAIIAALPYSLTLSQSRALDAIVADLGKPERMVRLLQGDVGSGKTVVALLAAAAVIEAGLQAALDGADRNPRAPAFQDHRAARRSGRHPRRDPDRTRTRQGTRRSGSPGSPSGEIDILVGTHALFQDDVVFRDLALAVIDEQHRFGVHQRLALVNKGEAVDMLVTTATPIPRTLVLTYFGDMDISELREKPAGRQPIDTRTIPLDRLPEVIDAVGRALDDGQRVYWVCPLVEESETSDLAAAEDRFKALRKRFGALVDLVHGKMRGTDKDEAMRQFAVGETRLLVSTTVIEVGVDVPEATVMAIEHAERFGLVAAAPVARPHRTRPAANRPAFCSTALRSARPPRRGSRSCARPRTASASPRRT